MYVNLLGLFFSVCGERCEERLYAARGLATATPQTKCLEVLKVLCVCVCVCVYWWCMCVCVEYLSPCVCVCVCVDYLSPFVCMCECVCGV